MFSMGLNMKDKLRRILGKNFLKSKLKTLPIKKHSDEIKNSCLSKGVNKTVREGICKTTKHVVLIHNFWT
jgi:hypothetical protein